MDKLARFGLDVTRILKRDLLERLGADPSRYSRPDGLEIEIGELTSIPRWAINSSTSRKLRLNLKYSQTAWRITSPGSGGA